MSGPGSLTRLLGAPVRVSDARVGHVVGVVADPGFTRVVGFDVLGASGARTFLPWVAATADDDGEVRAASSLVFFETVEIDAYARQRAVTIRSPGELALLERSLARTGEGEVGERVSAEESEGIPAG